MIPYQTFCQLRHDLDVAGLSATQTAEHLHLAIGTVLRWANQKHYLQRKPSRRSSKLDEFKSQILAMLERHPYNAMQILHQLRLQGYQGGRTILADYIAKARPARREAFLTLHFEPGQCAQLDWGSAGWAPVGSIQRRLSFFVMVLCHSRMMYVEFTLGQSQEHFLDCHQRAFEFFGGVPQEVMIDNLKSAVLSHPLGEPAQFHPRYLDFARHHGFTPKACAVRRPNQKGRVESAVGYIKGNFLAGLQMAGFESINPAARTWLDTVANVRIHGATHQKPVDLFQIEKPKLQPLHPLPYDVAICRAVRATRTFRVVLDTNRYSVPCEHAAAMLNLKATPQKLFIYRQNQLIAEHVRSYERHRDFENPDHVRPLLIQRLKAREQKLLARFLALSPRACDYYEQLKSHRFNAAHHARKILALSEIYGQEALTRAMDDAFDYQAFSSEYIANILQQRQRCLAEPSALALTRTSDLLDIELPPADLSIYEPKQKTNEPKEPQQ